MLRVKAIGHQWYWSYYYPNFKDIEFDCYMEPIKREGGYKGLRLLETDNSVVVPRMTAMRIIVSSVDVIHAWTVPALGLKTDAIPGRLNQIIFMVDRIGIFFGQCSEICGANHSFIPIKVESVPLRVFLSWVSRWDSLVE